MTKKPKIELSALEWRIGHAFQDRSLLARALTHLSAPAAGGADRTQSYQRLEFLGDRVLGVVVAHMLYQAYPQASEGELSMRLAKFVRRETCAEVAAEWDVGPHRGDGAGRSARRRPQEGGDPRRHLRGDHRRGVSRRRLRRGARGRRSRSWRKRMDADVEPERDAKTAVQEWAQARALAAPRYVELTRSGPAHAPHFVMQVVLDGYEPESGEANSKRAAEQAAAQAFLARRGSS